VEGLPKLIIAALLGVVVTGAGAWLTWASDVVTEAKAIDLIELHSPYRDDRALVKEALSEVKELRKELFEHQEEFKELAAELKTELRMHHGRTGHE
jgi:Tfp pilus assembly protein PilO